MLALDLTNAPRWHDLAPGVRVQLRPLTTALMVATRSDPAVEAVTEEASDEERAVAFAKALARRAVLAWEGIGDADGNSIDPSPEAIDALDARWPGMRDRICDSRPRIRRNINVFVAGERAQLATPLAPGTEMVVLLAITG